MEIKELVPRPSLFLKKTRVAAYCRVSSREEKQESSFDAQIAVYYDRITKDPTYELAGIFSDYARSGTSTRRRPEFKRMIKLCELGLIDLILTKSISRFARNTIDTLETIEKLRNLGVVVEFEEQNIRTDDPSFDMLLTVYSSVAQQEAVSNSDNRKWQIKAEMQEGKFKNTYLYGYHCYGDGRLEINEEQAMWVRYIFSSYASGMLIAHIIDELERKGVKSPIGKPRWNKTTINEMLKNEKYTGDARLQKTYTKKVGSRINTRNRGELTSYYVENHHKPIIPHELFDKVQEVFESRRQHLNMPLGRQSGPEHPYAHYIYSIEHDKFLSRKITHKGYPYETISFQYVGKTDKPIFLFYEHVEQLFVEVIKYLQEEPLTLKTRINDFIAKNYEKTKISENLQEFQTKIDELNDKKAAILELPIDDEKKNELCADIDLELDSLNLQLGREKSRKVMEFTTTDELSEKCRILKNEDLDPTDTSVVKSLFESLVIKGKQEMWIVMRGTNMAFNDESIKIVQFMHPFASGEFTYIKKKVTPVKTKWHLIIY